MNCATFDSAEILANTAGRFAMYEHKKNGVSLDFMSLYVETLNRTLKEEGQDVSLDFNAKVLEHAIFLGSIAYYRNDADGLFYVNKSLMYKVLAHIDRSEERIMELIRSRGSLGRKNKLWEDKQPVRVLLRTVFNKVKGKV